MVTAYGNTLNIQANGIVLSNNGSFTPITTANDGVLITSNTGVPSWLANSATAGFVLAANSGAPPSWVNTYPGITSGSNPASGFIGEQIRSNVPVGSIVSISTGSNVTITSITLSAGIWDISALGMMGGVTSAGTFNLAISTTNNSLGSSVLGDSQAQINYPLNAAGVNDFIAIPSYRVAISGSTIYYMVGNLSYTTGSGGAYGRISATRVG